MDTFIGLGHLILGFSARPTLLLEKTFVSFEVREVGLNYILCMHIRFFSRKDSISELGQAQLVELFSFTSQPTDPIPRKGQPEKQNTKLKWPYGYYAWSQRVYKQFLKQGWPFNYMSIQDTRPTYPQMKTIYMYIETTLYYDCIICILFKITVL